MKFLNAASQESLSPEKFDDGTADYEANLHTGVENLYFTIKKAGSQLGTTVDIQYYIYLFDYPEVITETEVFTVTYINGTELSNQNDINGTELSNQNDINGTELSNQNDEQIFYERPKIMPSWLKGLTDIRIVLGEDDRDLRYPMGEAISAYGDQMLVVCHFGSLQDFVKYNSSKNEILIFISQLGVTNIGYHNIIVNATYTSKTG